MSSYRRTGPPLSSPSTAYSTANHTTVDRPSSPRVCVLYTSRERGEGGQGGRVGRGTLAGLSGSASRCMMRGRCCGSYLLQQRINSGLANNGSIDSTKARLATTTTTIVSTAHCQSRLKKKRGQIPAFKQCIKDKTYSKHCARKPRNCGLYLCACVHRNIDYTRM